MSPGDHPIALADVTAGGAPERPVGRYGEAIRRGFSLIELLIVVSVFAIAGAMVVPRLGSTEESRLRLAAGLIVADLEFAQSESIAHPDDLRRINFDTSTATWSIRSASGKTTPIIDPISKRSYSTTFGSDRAATLKDVTIKSISVGGDSDLGFGAYGQLDQTSAATITLACGARTVTLSVDPVIGEASVGAIK